MISALHVEINTRPFTETDFGVLSASAIGTLLGAHTKPDASVRPMYCICIASPIV